jgi:putative flippase GtrA
MKRLFWFAVAGGTGFTVDVSVLVFLTHVLSLNAFVARIVSIACAMCATWLMNRTFTFMKSRHSTAQEATRYGLVAIATALINYGLYSGTMLLFPALWPAIAAGFATSITMFLSFMGYSKLVFRPKARP